MSKYHNFHPLVILNLTPDSFSEVERLDTPQKVLEKILLHYQQGIRRFDLGAQSTSPLAKPISNEEEMKRWKSLFFPLIEENCLPQDIQFSIDTLRPMSFYSIYEKLGKNEVLWNDQTGMVDEEVIRVLRDCPKAKYVCMHSYQSGSKDNFQARNRMYQGSFDDLKKEILQKFRETWNLFVQNGLEERLIFDLGYSFGKDPLLTRQLIKETSLMIHQLKDEGVKTAWMISISKKTCLRDSTVQKVYEHGADMAEYFHFSWLVNWQRHLRDIEVYFRLHDPKIYLWAMKFDEWFE